MVTLKQVDAKSAGLVGFWFGAALMMTQITFFIVFFMFQSSQFPTFLLEFGFWVAVVRVIVIVSLQTAIFFGASAYIYNLISRWHGGLKLEFEPMATTKKRKNDDLTGNGDDGDDDNGPTDYKRRVEID